MRQILVLFRQLFIYKLLLLPGVEIAALEKVSFRWNLELIPCRSLHRESNKTPSTKIEKNERKAIYYHLEKMSNGSRRIGFLFFSNRMIDSSTFFHLSSFFSSSSAVPFLTMIIVVGVQRP